MTTKLYWKSTCSTCRNARSFLHALDRAGAAPIEERNYSKAPLVEAELKEMLARASVAELLNTRHARAKAEGWKATPPSPQAFIAAVLEDNNLVRRPVLLAGDRAVVGFDEAAMRAALD